MYVKPYHKVPYVCSDDKVGVSGPVTHQFAASFSNPAVLGSSKTFCEVTKVVMFLYRAYAMSASKYATVLMTRLHSHHKQEGIVLLLAHRHCWFELVGALHVWHQVDIERDSLRRCIEAALLTVPW